MKLYYAAASPFVRKVLAQAHETGIVDQIDLETVATSPVQVDPGVAAVNPVKKIPALATNDGMTLFDSPVICEYLDSQHSGAKMFPAVGPARWEALRLQALGDGLMDAAILGIYEGRIRPEDKRYQPWVDAQMAKVDGALDDLESKAGTLGDRVDIGTITVGCALGYLDFRYADKDWRAGRPALAAWYARFSARPSMQATAPKAA
ncbi:MAG: glutathione S-transferase [Alphaproteobacteria bacterium]|nr:glutathione S-transferase [Alphaproteobacteria bacterium]